MVLFRELSHLVRPHDARSALGRILFDDLLELFYDDISDLRLGFYDLLELFDLVLERLGLLRALQNIFLVDVAQADVRDELGLDLVDVEAFHQVRDDLRVLLGAANDGDRLVDVEQDPAQTEQQMQLVLFLAELEEYAAADAFRAPRRPLL